MTFRSSALAGWPGALVLPLMLAAAGALPGRVALAQDGGCQLVDSTSGPRRQILRCPSGPTVEAEAAAKVQVIKPTGTTHPTGARIGSGAALVDVPEGYPGGFEIETPRAVATVRGTLWAVDVQPARTSVFVLRGEVQVRRLGSNGGVSLKKGQGVDVGKDGAPLRVIRWPPRRAAALLARFGR